jgi:hypothetical protein
MKSGEQKEIIVEASEPNLSHPSSKGPGATTAQGPQSIDTEQLRSSNLRNDKGNFSSLARRATGPRTPAGKERSKQNSRKHGIFSKVVLLKDEPRSQFDSLLRGLREDLQPEGMLEEVLVEKLVALLWRHRRLMIAETAEIRKGVEFLDCEEKQQQEQQAHTVLGLDPHFQGGLTRVVQNPQILQRCMDLLDSLKSRVKKDGFDAERDKETLIRLYGPYTEDYGSQSLFVQYGIWMYAAEHPAEERQGTIDISPGECVHIFLEAIEKEKRRLVRLNRARASIEAGKMHLEVLRRNVPDAPELDRLLRYETSLERSFDRALSQLERLQRMRIGQPVLPELKVRLSG